MHFKINDKIYTHFLRTLTPTKRQPTTGTLSRQDLQRIVAEMVG